jgi:hypothetical protein
MTTAAIIIGAVALYFAVALWVASKFGQAIKRAMGE